VETETNLGLINHNSNTCKGNRSNFSPRVRACRGFNSTAPPLSPASQNLKPLEEDTGLTFVADNTKMFPVRDRATTFSPLIASCLMFWMDPNEWYLVAQ
jgi:hypothetical protein